MEMKPQYKMIDYSKEEGDIFLSIYHGEKNNKNIRLLLVKRGNKKKFIELKACCYGEYLEFASNIKDIFNWKRLKREEVWDLNVFNGEDYIDIKLGRFESYMTDYYELEESSYKCKPYISGHGILSVFFKKTIRSE